MLTETFLTKLKAAFRTLFIDGHNVHDDTLLDKFATMLKEILEGDDSGDVLRVLEAFERIDWMPVMFENYKKLDPRVVAFGLTVIGTMSASWACHPFVAARSKATNGFVTKLMTEYADCQASIRCSAIQMLRTVLATEMSDPIFNELNVTKVVCHGLEDRSIFVQRAAKELTVDYLVSSLKRTRDDDHFDRIVGWIMDLIRKSDDDVRMGLVGLEVLLEVSETKRSNDEKESQEIVSLLCKKTKIRVVAMDAILGSNDERICVSCCHLLLATNAWSFKSGVPSEWMVVFEMLLKKRQPMTAVVFVVKTCTKFLDRRQPIPIELKSLLIAPLASSLDWKANGVDHWLQSSQWDVALKEYAYEKAVLMKLLCFVLAGISKLKDFLLSDEKVDFINRLLVTLLDTRNLMAISSKIQMAITSTLIASLKEMVTDMKQSTKAIKDRVEVWKNVLCASEQPSSSASVSTQRMQMVRILIKWIDSDMEEVWNKEIGDRLNLLLQKRCHDIHWEVRDSAVETVGEIIDRSRELLFLQTWCIRSGLLKVTMANFDDTESYVRASILHVLSYTSSIPILREEVAKIVSLENLMSILLTDDEGVTRRAAAKALLSLTLETLTRFRIEKQDLFASIDDQIVETFLIASSDLDWEVKLISIEFWQHMLEFSNALDDEDQIESQFQFLSRIGFNDALIIAAMDQDLSVRRKAATVIRRLKQLPVINKRLLICSTEEVETEPTANVEAEQQPEEKMDFVSDEDKYEAIDNVLDTIDSDIVSDVMMLKPNTITSSKSELQKLIAKHHHFHRGRTSERKFFLWLMNFNLNELSERNDQTTDVYSSNPEALLDDLLVVNRESEIKDEDEDIALDCY